MEKNFEQMLHERIYINSQWAYEKILNILSYRETKIKTIVKYCFILTRMAKIKDYLVLVRIWINWEL